MIIIVRAMTILWEVHEQDRKISRKSRESEKRHGLFLAANVLSKVWRRPCQSESERNTKGRGA